jgi:glycosyltransferase involved in cell wall biosynthesis
MQNEMIAQKTFKKASAGLAKPYPFIQHDEMAGRPMKTAYIMSRFPKITETFILYEMLAVEEQGIQVEVYPLQRERSSVVHPEAKQYVERAHFHPFLSWQILLAHLYFLFQRPGAYWGALWVLLRANWGSLRYLGGAFLFFPKIVYFARKMQAEGIEHVHAHFASHPAAAAFVIHRLTGIPYSFTAHGSDLHRDQHMLREKVAEAAFVVPISEYNRKLILGECNGRYADKALVIHCGVDTQVFQPRAEATPYEQGQSRFMILCIGTLHEVKGQTYLIEACRLLRERGLDVECHFAGDGEDLSMLQQQVARANLTTAVVFHGRVKRDEIVQLLSRADVVVTPSVQSCDGRREGIPVVLMEAMGSGAPVVASNLSGIPELVKDGKSGLLATPGDASAIAAAIERLYREPQLRQRLGQQGRTKVLEEFDLSKNAIALANQFRAER